MYMKTKLIFLPCFAAAIFMSGCAGSATKSENLEIPPNMPPACRDIDFVEQPDMREMCGVRVVHMRSYKNIPQLRYLIKPYETSLVKTSDKLELRFQNSLPIYLDGPIVDEIEFTQDKRLEKIKNTYDYHEIYQKGAERIRIFKMEIPTDKGNVYSYCFRVPEKKGNARTRSVAMGNHIEAMTCSDYNQLLAETQKTH